MNDFFRGCKIIKNPHPLNINEEYYNVINNEGKILKYKDQKPYNRQPKVFKSKKDAEKFLNTDVDKKILLQTYYFD